MYARDPVGIATKRGYDWAGSVQRGARIVVQFNHLNNAQKEQTKGSEQVMTAVVQIKQVAEAQTSSVRDLEAAIGDLANQAEVLRGEVRRFRV